MKKRLLIFPPLLIGIIIFVVVIKNKAQPLQSELNEIPLSVRAILIKPTNVVPKAIGYGSVQPKDVWKAVAEVSGKITKLHDDLSKGNFLKAGEQIIAIDNKKLLLQRAQIMANIASTKAQVDQKKIEKENLQASEKIEKLNLATLGKELDRLKKLVLENRVESESSLDRTNREYLTQQSKLQSIQNSLGLIPSSLDILQAQLELNNAQLETANIDIQNSIIKVPFNCRVDKVDIEKGQFVPAGTILVEAYSIDVSEIYAQFSVDKVHHLIPANQTALFNPDPKTIANIFKVKAIIRIQIGDYTVKWTDAYFSRINSEIDPKTRTIGIVVAVDDSYKKAIPGVRPPLTKGMFCEVELQSVIRENAIVIPRLSIHQDQVYIIDSENRLRKKNVKVDFMQDSFAVIKDGLNENDKLIVSDLATVVEGMLLEPKIDENLTSQLILEAESKEEIK